MAANKPTKTIMDYYWYESSGEKSKNYYEWVLTYL